MGQVQQPSYRPTQRSSLWTWHLRGFCCPVVAHASSTSLLPHSHHGMGCCIRAGCEWAKLEVTLAHDLICGGVYPDVQVPVQPPPQSRLSCELRAAHWGLYPHEIFLERKLHNMSRHSDLSLTVLMGTHLSYQQSHLPEPTAGNTQGGQVYVLDCHQEASSVLPTIILEVSNSGHAGQEQIFSVENPASRLSQGRPDQLVDLHGGAGPPLLPQVATSRQSGWASSTRPCSDDTVEIIINFCCFFF